ncbi:MAG: hypothetical protein LW850_07325 [Planctomycetaceae bacterium]|nr:hypothetical protein [Planctomycetaceae bacterium]
MNIFARKSLEELNQEARAEGQGTLKRHLGPVNLILLGIGAITGWDVLCRVLGHDPGLRECLHLLLCHDGGTLCMDHRMGLGA